MEPVLRAAGLTKSFGQQQILRGLTFDVSRGECVSFIGENGAGKSTLAKCLVGVHAPDAGTITVHGAEVTFSSPRAAQEHGIGLLPQELAYVPDLTVFENVVLGRWPGSLGFTNAGAMRRYVRERMERFGIDLPLSHRMRDLTLGDRQMVEIVKALVRNAEVLILDEPTAALSGSESAQLIEILTALKADGLAAIYISHRMDEVAQFSDTIHVLRNGVIELTTTPERTTQRELVTAMLGQEPEQLAALAEVDRQGPPAIAVRGLGTPASDPADRVDFEVAPGEVLGIYGVRGSGVEFIAEALGGLRPEAVGEIEVGSRTHKVFGSPLKSQDAGLAYVPAERKRNGLVLGMSIHVNVVLGIAKRLTRWGFLRRKEEIRIARRLAKETDVRSVSLAQSVGELSGGNQQKVLLASRLAFDPKLMVLHEPTRGVDAGARVQIHRHLRGMADDGLSCLLVSSDVEEVVSVSDRLLVIRDGRLVGELTAAQKTQERALLLSAGEVV